MLRPGGRIRFAFVPALGYGPHRATAPQMAFADRDRIVPYLWSLLVQSYRANRLNAIASQQRIDLVGGQSAI